MLAVVPAALPSSGSISAVMAAQAFHFRTRTLSPARRVPIRSIQTGTRVFPGRMASDGSPAAPDDQMASSSVTTPSAPLGAHWPVGQTTSAKVLSPSGASTR
jgi:hypothetical protein